jgi:hypothetical protein
MAWVRAEVLSRVPCQALKGRPLARPQQLHICRTHVWFSGLHMPACHDGVCNVRHTSWLEVQLTQLITRCNSQINTEQHQVESSGEGGLGCFPQVSCKIVHQLALSVSVLLYTSNVQLNSRGQPYACSDRSGTGHNNTAMSWMHHFDLLSASQAHPSSSKHWILPHCTRISRKPTCSHLPFSATPSVRRHAQDAEPHCLL